MQHSSEPLEPLLVESLSLESVERDDTLQVSPTSGPVNSNGGAVIVAWLGCAKSCRVLVLSSFGFDEKKLARSGVCWLLFQHIVLKPRESRFRAPEEPPT